MNNKLSVSVILPAYNVEKTIKDCLNKIIEETNELEAEIIVVDDNSEDRTAEIVKTFKGVNLIKLDNNQGAGNARNIGVNEAIYENLCFIDSDIIISHNSIINLVKRLKKDKEVGTVSACQDSFNLNKNSWSSYFVCLKSSYGVEEIEKETEFSSCCSEFFVISKKLFFEAGKFKTFNSAGGEEFHLGYKITQLNKKNIKTKGATYSAHYCDLYTRFKNIVQRTSKYIPLFIQKKKFDSKGTFATFGQFFSSLLTLIIIFYILFCLFSNNAVLTFELLSIIIFQLVIELKFLIFSQKKYGLKMVLFSLFGIQVINFGILYGAVIFFYKTTIGKILKNH